MTRDATNFHPTVSTVEKLRRGIVWCTVCGRSRHVDSGECLSHGWPKCCELTMTLDSPAERAAFEAKRKEKRP